MKKFILVSILMGMLPLSMVAQDDDLYFVPQKKSATTEAVSSYGLPKGTYYSGSSRNVDEYNRRVSSYEVLGGDTINDIIDFSAVQGVYPDSIQSEDFELTKKMQRFEDYNLSANAAFWEGYYTGIRDWNWGWQSPWFYSRYGWYGSWYDPWYYGGYSWADPWYWSVYGYGPYYYRYSYWGTPYYYDYGYYPYYYYSGGGGRHYYAHNGNTGSINLGGGSRVVSHQGGGLTGGSGSRVLSSSRNAERTNSLRNRTVGSSRTTTVNRSSNTNFNGSSRMSSTASSSSSSYSSGSYSGGSSVSSGGGGVSRSSGGGGGGGGGPRGGRR